MCLNHLITELSLKNYRKIDYVKITLASNKIIKSWSYGEVTKSETLNYRTLVPEFGGLFCQKIFGPIKDYECACGKYKSQKFINITCEECNVLVCSSKIRRTRMGHIQLACPVVQFWFLKAASYLLTAILNISIKDINLLLQNKCYLIVNPGVSNLMPNIVISYEEYYILAHEFESKLISYTGINAFIYLIKNINLYKRRTDLYRNLNSEHNLVIQSKILKQIKIVDNFISSGNTLENIVISILPVLPADLRPLVLLEGGKFANSDLNVLYRRVINRNNRLKKLISISAPIEVIQNEQVLLQESVNTLIDNEKSLHPYLNQNNNQFLKSISDILKGKHGRFRANLLGKRVDYSGRSVIVVGPDLELHQCGLPIKMAIELFKPFIINKLLSYNYNFSINEIINFIKQKNQLIIDVLKEIVIDFPILLNRAPTLHRLGIQAFYPILIDTNAIRLHPLVCMAFNADFDGDQMAVHIPLTVEARMEARSLILSTNNLLAPSSGSPILIPSQDVVLGLYYLTKSIETQGKIKTFFYINDVISAYNLNYISINNEILFINKNNELACSEEKINTTVGRILLYSYLQKKLNFNFINFNLHKKDLVNIIKICFIRFNKEFAINISSAFARIGFKFATVFGISISLDDMKIDRKKKFITDIAKKKVININQKFNDQYISESERYSKIINIWYDVNNQVKRSIKSTISYSKCLDNNSIINNNSSFNNINCMLESGARGTEDQLLQLAGMRGLMSKPDGSIIEYPILSSLKDGLTISEYFISTHGARKGLSDTSLKTANAGYLTRRLVDVAQELYITNLDCGTKYGIDLEINFDLNFSKNIFGRITINNIVDPISFKIIITKNSILGENECHLIQKSKIRKVKVRSVIFCLCKDGLCAYCYGLDLSKNILVNLGESVGIIAAQSIGEPGTQLTMRTFHSGGANLVTISKCDKNKIYAQYNGFLLFLDFKFLINKENIKINLSLNAKVCIYNTSCILLDTINLSYGSKVFYNDYDSIKKGDVISEKMHNNLCVFSQHQGYVRFVNFNHNVNVKKIRTNKNEFLYILKEKFIQKEPFIEIVNNSEIHQYFLLNKSILLVKETQYINVGDIICYMNEDDLGFSDITGGLLKISNLFEVRDVKNTAQFSIKSGFITMTHDSFNQTNFGIRSDNHIYKYNIEKKKKIKILQGYWVEKGDLITNGILPINEMLEIKGLNYVINSFINEIQSVYVSQGIFINNKHIEVILRQMMKKCQILSSAKNEFIQDDIVNLCDVQLFNSYLNNKKNKIFFKRKIFGITKSALSTNSFISAASFQETNKVLAEAAFFGKKDFLTGLKENVILGSLIPSGTGFKKN